MAEWISVEDRLPETKSNVLVHYVHSYSQDDGCYALGIVFYNGVRFGLDDTAYRITHWMPLPEPPQKERETE